MTDTTSSKLLTSKAKEIVCNVSEHFRNEGKGFLERTAEATGVGRTTVVKVRREKTQTGKMQSPTMHKREDYKSLDNFEDCVIRNKIHQFYTVRKQLSTFKGIDVKVAFDKCIT